MTVTAARTEKIPLSPMTPEMAVTAPPVWENRPAPRPAAPNDADYALAYEALAKTFDHTKHRESKQPSTLPRARIMGTGTSAIRGVSDAFTASAANPYTGTLVLAESKGNGVGAIAAANGFVREMDRTNAARASVRSAASKMERALNKTLPGMFRRAPHEAPLQAATQAIQIVDNKLICAGHRPVYVYNLETDECKRLIYTSGTGGSVHTLPTGRNVIIMGSEDIIHGRTSTLDMTRHVRAAMATPSSGARQPADPTEQPHYQASHLATQLRGRLAAPNGRSGTVMVSIVDVSQQKIRRPEQLPDTAKTRHASAALARLTLATSPLIPQPESRSRAEARRGRLSGRLGKIALASAAVVMGVAVLTGANALTDKPTRPPQASGSPASVSQEQHPAASTAPPVPITRPAIEPFPDNYTALARDPANNNKPSNVTEFSVQSLTRAGRQAGLSDAEIAGLVDNSALIQQLNTAFMHDTTSPENGHVRYDKHHWLAADKTYSLHDVNIQAQKIAADRAAQLGIAPATTPDAPTDTPPADSPATIPAAGPTGPNKVSTAAAIRQTEAVHLTEVAVGLAALAGMFMAAKALRRRQAEKLAARIRRLKKEAERPGFTRLHGFGKRAKAFTKVGLLDRKRPNPSLIGTTPVPPGYRTVSKSNDSRPRTKNERRWPKLPAWHPVNRARYYGKKVTNSIRRASQPVIIAEAAAAESVLATDTSEPQNRPARRFGLPGMRRTGNTGQRFGKASQSNPSTEENEEISRWLSDLNVRDQRSFSELASKG